MLRIFRITLSIVLFTLITFFFIDFAGWLPKEFHALEHIQFVPAWLGRSLGIMLFIIVLTLLFGRFYCSSICPMGVFQDIVAWISKCTSKKKKRYSFSKAKTVLRWSVLAVVLITFFAGFPLLLGLVDPYSAYGRFATHLFKPVYATGNNLLELIFTSFGNHTFYKVDVSIMDIFTFIATVVTFLAISFLAWKNGRTFCNTVCPVGTVLGFLSKFSLFKVKIDTEKCNHCGLCGMSCKASCLNSKEQDIDYSRCVDCFDCLEACNKKALKFTYNPSLPSFLRKQEPPQTTKNQEIAGQARNDENSGGVDEGRRKFFLAGITAAVTAPSLLAQAKNNLLTDGKIVTRQTPIAPPGALSHEHLQHHCTSCHLCVSKCPSHVLKPALTEYGLGGLMQPMMYFEKGFCNYNCTLCSNICPNGALTPLTKEEKHATQMGRAILNKEVCVVYAKGYNCGACSEHCPTQAVSMKAVPGKEELTAPVVDESLCIGCGGCEFICPVRPHRAIFVEGNATYQKAIVTKEETKKKTDTKIDDFGF